MNAEYTRESSSCRPEIIEPKAKPVQCSPQDPQEDQRTGILLPPTLASIVEAMLLARSRNLVMQRLLALGLGPCMATISLSHLNPAYATTPPSTLASTPAKAPRRGVGLIISGGILGSLALQVTTIAFPLYLAAKHEGNFVEPSQSSWGPLDLDASRATLVGGLVGLAISGAMLAGGIVMNQRYHQWKSSGGQAWRRYRIAPTMTWSPKRGSFSLTGSF